MIKRVFPFGSLSQMSVCAVRSLRLRRSLGVSAPFAWSVCAVRSLRLRHSLLNDDAKVQHGHCGSRILYRKFFIFLRFFFFS